MNMARCIARIGLALSFLVFIKPASAGVYDDILVATNEGRNAEVIELLDRGMDVNTALPDGTTLLMIAARNGNGDLLDFLLRKRANYLKRNRYGDTALMLAALNGHPKLVHALGELQGHSFPAGTWTPLHYAVFNGHADIVRYLLQKGISPDARAPNRETSLMLAARLGQAPVIQVLLLAGPDLALENADGLTAQAIAEHAGHADIAEMLRAAAARAVKPH